jgi:ATP-binding cassette, subfamily B, bacterial
MSKKTDARALARSLHKILTMEWTVLLLVSFLWFSPPPPCLNNVIALPRLIGQLMDPKSALSSLSLSAKGKSSSSSSSTCVGGRSPEQQLLLSIVGVGLLGGTASFLRTVMLNRAKGNIAARLRLEAFESLLLQRDLEWFQFEDDDEQEEAGEKVEAVGNTNEEETEAEEKVVEDKNESTTTSTTTKNESAPPLSPAKKESSSSTKPKSFHPGMTPSAIAVILKDDVDQVADMPTATVANLLRSTSSCVMATYNMLRLNPSLVGLSLVVAPIVGTVLMMTRKYLKQVLAHQQRAHIETAQFLEERLNHRAMVQLCHREQDEVDAYQTLQQTLTEYSHQSALANGLSMGTMFALSTTALCGILWAGGRSVKANRMTHGELVSFGTYSFLLALGSGGVFSALGEYNKGTLAAMRLYKLIKEDVPQSSSSSSQPESSSSSSTIELNVPDVQSITLERVYFTYKRNPSTAILRNISLKLARGEVVALVGKNGSGKTTIASLLAGLYKPTSGSILVRTSSTTTTPATTHTSTPGAKDNTNLQGSTSSAGSTSSQTLQVVDYVNELDRMHQSQLVQLVPQSPALFNTTILNNVKYSCPEASLDEVMDVLSKTQCQEYIAKLEGGVNYPVGANGCRLSGGQRQRLGLARALLSNPAVLILDEPTSSLDAEGETAVLDAIHACRSANRALLVITHRATTLDLADRVVVLEEGAIVEMGSPSELQAKADSALNSLMPNLL